MFKRKIIEKRKNEMLLIILGAIGLFLLLFIYSACVISSRCSREEEKRDEYIRNVQKTIKRR